MSIEIDQIPIAPEQFFAWVAGRDQKYELVDGEVIMMAGAGRRHDRIVVNLTTTIHTQLRGGPCQTFTGDTYVATASMTRRMPDLGVDCGKPEDSALVADKPALIVEVLSPTTSGFDLTVKLAEYQSIICLDYILLIDTESPNVHLYWRDNAGHWMDEVLKGGNAVVNLAKVKLSFTTGDIYDGLDFRPRPTLVDRS